LRRAPANFSALNEFGTLLTNMGAIDAACRVYSEAIAHHPANPIGHVNLASLQILEMPLIQINMLAQQLSDLRRPTRWLTRIG
jgi:hypothetical protein